MVLDIYKIRSSISPEYKKKQLFRGTLIAVLGLVPIYIGGTLLQVDQLERWGLPLFILGGSLIVLGLVPYRKLCHIEMNPSEVQIEQNDTLSYFEFGKLKLTLRVSQIKKIEAVEKGQIYGMAIYLKATSSKKYDYFFPYFKRNSVENIRSFI